MKLELAEIQELARAVAEELAARPEILTPRGRAPMLKMSEVAELFNVDPDTVRRWADRGYLPCIRVSPDADRRFPREEVLALIDKGGRHDTTRVPRGDGRALRARPAVRVGVGRDCKPG